MLIYLEGKHGIHIAHSETEAKKCEENGWTRTRVVISEQDVKSDPTLKVSDKKVEKKVGRKMNVKKVK